MGTVNPVRRGRVVQLYANGVSPLDGKVESGEPAPAQPLLRCRVTPNVTIGGRPAEVSFCGLAPFIVGLYQINATVPEDTPVGIQPVVVSAGGVSSQSASLPIQ